jgi:hypothetical protein
MRYCSSGSPASYWHLVLLVSFSDNAALSPALQASRKGTIASCPHRMLLSVKVLAGLLKRGPQVRLIG